MKAWREFGEPGDRLSLARVFAAALIAAAVGAGIGYVFDLVVGPLIGQSGWWTVFMFGFLILGAMLQSVREYAVPRPGDYPNARLTAVGPANAAADEPPSPTDEA